MLTCPHSCHVYCKDLACFPSAGVEVPLWLVLFHCGLAVFNEAWCHSIEPAAAAELEMLDVVQIEHFILKRARWVLYS